ncbi:MAG: glycosyltransferase family 92 protein [Parachlamydia sp.]|nr:glycosyltransferase family 92 protein [Parachlamydia sp.]
MKIFLYFWFLFASYTLYAKDEYNLSVCMIFNNEAEYLQEWIEFHRLLGVEHFFLYNNNSKDNYKEVLNLYLVSGIVELIEWPEVANDVFHWDKIQIAAYNDCLKRAQFKTKWLAILDSDEFLFPTNDCDLNCFLEKYEGEKSCGGILVNWVCFGTSWVKKIPKDKLLIECLTLSNGVGSETFKSIVMPKKVEYVCSPHYVLYKEGVRHFTPNGGLPPFIEIEKIRINHYWSRDEWFLKNVKIPRRLVWGLDQATCILWAEAANNSYDPSILRFVAPLKTLLKKGEEN